MTATYIADAKSVIDKLVAQWNAKGTPWVSKDFEDASRMAELMTAVRDFFADYWPELDTMNDEHPVEDAILGYEKSLAKGMKGPNTLAPRMVFSYALSKGMDIEDAKKRFPYEDWYPDHDRIRWMELWEREHGVSRADRNKKGGEEYMLHGTRLAPSPRTQVIMPNGEPMSMRTYWERTRPGVPFPKDAREARTGIPTPARVAETAEQAPKPPTVPEEKSEEPETEADRIRREATAQADLARAEAERIMKEAESRILALEAEARAKAEAEAEAERVRQLALSHPELRQQGESFADWVVRRTGIKNPTFIRLCWYLNEGCQAMLYGPAGVGKTYWVSKAGELLGAPLFLTTAPQTAAKLTGYTDAHGNPVLPEFARGCTCKSVNLIDEIDRSQPPALIELNAPLANGIVNLPGQGTVAVHEDCIFVATSNTNGMGGSNGYGTAQRLDASTLDRFVKLWVDWDHDSATGMAQGDEELLAFAEAYRKACRGSTMGMFSYRAFERMRASARCSVETGTAPSEQEALVIALDEAVLGRQVKAQDLSTRYLDMKKALPSDNRYLKAFGLLTERTEAYERENSEAGM